MKNPSRETLYSVLNEYSEKETVFFSKDENSNPAIDEHCLQHHLQPTIDELISHQQNLVGKTYAAIDAVSKPTRKVTPSGTYDPAAAQQRYADWKAKSSATPANAPARQAAPRPTSAPQAVAPAPSKSAEPAAAPAAEFDPEVGF